MLTCSSAAPAPLTMSLKAFHVVFITASVLLAFCFARLVPGPRGAGRDRLAARPASPRPRPVSALVGLRGLVPAEDEEAAVSRAPGASALAVARSPARSLLGGSGLRRSACPSCFGQARGPARRRGPARHVAAAGRHPRRAGRASCAFFLYLRRRAAQVAAQALDEEWSRLQRSGNGRGGSRRTMTSWHWLPQLASEHGAALDRTLGLVHVLMVVLFVGWGAFFVYTLVRFRRAAEPGRRLRRRHQPRLDLARGRGGGGGGPASGRLLDPALGRPGRALPAPGEATRGARGRRSSSPGTSTTRARTASSGAPTPS